MAPEPRTFQKPTLSSIDDLKAKVEDSASPRTAARPRSFQKPKLPTIHDLSEDSEDSASLRTEFSYPSANGRYASSQSSLGSVHDKQVYRRVHDHENLLMTSKTSSGGKVVVHDHKKASHVSAEPRASEATSEDYARTHPRPRRHWARGKSSASSQNDEAVSETTISPELKHFKGERKATWITSVDTIKYPISEGSIGKPPQSQGSATDSLNLDSTEASSNREVFIWGMPDLNKNKKGNAELNLGHNDQVSKVSELIGAISTAVEHEGGTESEQTESENTSSGICRHLEDFELDEKQIVTPILDPAGQAMVDRIMAEFWLIFNQRWPSNVRQHAGYSRGPESHECPTSNPNTSRPRPFQKKRQRKDDDEDDRGRDRIHQPPIKSTPPPTETADQPRFACPFRKHDPYHYSIYTHRSCALSHWPSIARVKEHLYRSHQVRLHCERCWQTFDRQEDLTAHRIVDATKICQVKPGHPPGGLTPEIERKLRSRKKAHRNQSDEDRWRDMYRLLFPNEDVPSPYFEPLADDIPLSPDSRELANYEEYARRELPQMVRASVLEVFSREMQPIEASLVANLVETIQECQARLFRSYSDRVTEDQQEEAPSLSSLQNSPTGHQQPSDGENPMQTPSTFLDAVFHPPPPVETTGFEPSLQIHDLRHDLQDFETVVPSLSSSSKAMFSAHGHGSEYTSTTISSQSQAEDNGCPVGESQAQDEIIWQDWANRLCWTD